MNPEWKQSNRRIYYNVRVCAEVLDCKSVISFTTSIANMGISLRGSNTPLNMSFVLWRVACPHVHWYMAWKCQNCIIDLKFCKIPVAFGFDFYTWTRINLVVDCNMRPVEDSAPLVSLNQGKMFLRLLSKCGDVLFVDCVSGWWCCGSTRPSGAFWN